MCFANLLAAILYISLIASCATPLPISKLEPYQPTETYWLNGTEVITQTQDQLSVEIGFLKRDGLLYSFDVLITNQSNETILIDPTLFSYKPITTRDDTLIQVNATDPEKMILNAEITASRLDAERQRKIGQGLFFGAIELAADIADEDSDYENTTLQNTTVELMEIDLEKDRVLSNQVYWENGPIRKTSLLPEHYIQGEIFMEWTKKAEIIVVTLPIGEQIFEFPFKQTLIEVSL